MTKKAGSNTPKKVTQNLTIERLRSAQIRSVVVDDLSDGEDMVVHYRASSAKRMLELMQREDNADMSNADKFEKGVGDLADLLVNPDGSPFATKDDLMENLPFDAIAILTQAVTKDIVRRAEGNASSGATGGASPSA